MLCSQLISFNSQNRKLILALCCSALLWSLLVLLAWWGGRPVVANPVWGSVWSALQMYAAAQIMVPALLFTAEQRSRFFYFFWVLVLILVSLVLRHVFLEGGWSVLLEAVKSGILILTGTLVGTVLARYIKRMWELVPVCIVMSLADFSSWLAGPTSRFAEQITAYYQAPEGPAPLIDAVLIKLAYPGGGGLVPVFGISDWVMVTFFACVARQFGMNENLIGDAVLPQRSLRSCLGRYLPVPVAALYGAMMMARFSGLFIPVLPLLAVVMILWYSVMLIYRRQSR